MTNPNPEVVTALVELVRLRHNHPTITLRPTIDMTAPTREDLIEILHLAVGIVEHEISRTCDVNDYLSQLDTIARFNQITEGLDTEEEPPC